ncbi:MAG: energy transducer TonB [Methylococcales bacterium]
MAETTSSSLGKSRSFYDALMGEENPNTSSGLLFTLVLLLHLLAAQCLSQPLPPTTLAQPLMMEVSMVSLPGKQQTVEPPAPPKPPEPIKPKVEPKKPTVKKPLEKPKPQKPKQAELPIPLDTVTESLPEPNESAPSASNTAPPSHPTTSSGTQGTAAPYNEATFEANYGTNPKPQYPAFARSRGWQGKVLLRVNVTAEGRSESVEIYRSSGHDLLDESAIEAVEKWQFIPAKRGDQTVACTVIVPIIFTLNN